MTYSTVCLGSNVHDTGRPCVLSEEVFEVLRLRITDLVLGSVVRDDPDLKSSRRE